MDAKMAKARLVIVAPVKNPNVSRDIRAFEIYRLIRLVVYSYVKLIRLGQFSTQTTQQTLSFPEPLQRVTHTLADVLSGSCILVSTSPCNRSRRSWSIGEIGFGREF